MVVEVAELRLIPPDIRTSRSSGQDRVPADDLDLLRASGNPAHGRVVQPRDSSRLAQDTAPAGDADGDSALERRRHDQRVVDSVDGRLGVVGQAAGAALEDSAVPHGADGGVAVASSRGGGGYHLAGVGAVLEGADEGREERLPVVVGEVIRVGVLEDLRGDSLLPDVADVVALAGVVLEAEVSQS